MKTLVNIFDPQEPSAAYLFLKQYYQPGDRLLFISTRQDRDNVAPYASLFHIPEEQITIISFHRSQDSYIYERICRRLRSQLSQEVAYWVNLAGGSRYSALAIQHVFEQFNARFYYVQTRENLIVSSVFDDSIYDNDDTVEPITYRMTIGEYLQLHGLTHDCDTRPHTPIRSYAESSYIFECFKARRLTEKAYATLELLRLVYRGSRRPVEIAAIRKGSPGRRKPAPAIDELLTQLAFVPKKAGQLSPQELDYLTGGWFEEYVYHILSRHVKPQQIAIGVRIARPGNHQHNNELDVVFIKANTLFTVECKTGVATDHLFNEIVYKAVALKETFLGLSCRSYIFTLKNDYDHRLFQVADMMGITLCPKGTLTNPDKMQQVFEAIIRQSHEF